MNCKKCGKEISMNERFCSYCGTENAGQVNTQSDSIFANDEIKPKKNITLKKVIAIVLAIIVGSFIGKNIFAPALNSNSGNDISQTSSTNQFEFETIGDDAVSMVNPDYLEIIESSGIADIDNSFIGLKSNIYVAQIDGGAYEKIEYGYDNNIVKEVVSSLYYPISNYTESDIDNLAKAIKQQFNSLEQLSFCQIAYSRTDKYYCVTIKIKSLDNYENVKQLSSTEIFGTGMGVGLISMELTEDEMLSSGYVKKYIK